VSTPTLWPWAVSSAARLRVDVVVHRSGGLLFGKLQDLAGGGTGRAGYLIIWVAEVPYLLVIYPDHENRMPERIPAGPAGADGAGGTAGGTADVQRVYSGW
jgi:hypothetical protein